MPTFNPVEIIFQDVYFARKLKEKRPQCADCEHINQMCFHEKYYKSYLLQEVCSKCDKNKVGDDVEETGGY